MPGREGRRLAVKDLHKPAQLLVGTRQYNGNAGFAFATLPRYRCVSSQSKKSPASEYYPSRSADIFRARSRRCSILGPMLRMLKGSRSRAASSRSTSAGDLTDRTL